MKKFFATLAGIALLGAGCGATAPSPAPSDTAPAPAVNTEPARQTRTYDATDKNPGESLNPIDKGKELDSDVFHYKLLDVRKDGANYLLKLEVTNKTPLPLQTSVAEAFLSDRNDNSANNAFSIDFMYPRSKVGVDLGGDIAKFEPGQKVVGYYIYKLREGRTEPATMYVNIRNLGYNKETQKVDGVGGLGKAGSFKVR